MKWTYDLHGRVVEKRDTTNTKILEYAYNANGWLTNRWSLQKGNTKHLYDLVGNLTKVDYPTSADLLFDYDALNRATNDVRVGIITNRYTYHPGGQLESERTLNWVSSTVTSGTELHLFIPSRVLLSSRLAKDKTNLSILTDGVVFFRVR